MKNDLGSEITVQEFIVAWCKSSSAADVGKSLGVADRSKLYTQATNLRRSGVSLPPLKRGPRKSASWSQFSVDALNALIQKETKP